ncbi:DUF2306 domain-containing protein [Roseibium sp.]|uniref:DUF2306 domain-containing protein n=1 Tax=Roseibium sp. TaxID=1936156 RepID=UPI003A97DEE3
MQTVSRFHQVLAVLAAISCLAIALVSYRFVPLGVAEAMNFMAHHLGGNELLLYGHIAIAPLTLALLPVQFSARLRNARPRLHRWLGRVYVLLILGSGLASFDLAAKTTAGPLAGAGFALLAIFWLGTTLMGLLEGYRRNIPAHRRWMIRSAALTFAAVTLRLYLGSSMAAGLSFSTAYPAIAWLCWVPNLIIAEFYLRRRGRIRQVSARA